MYYFNFILNKFFGILFFPFQFIDPLWPLLFISVLTGILMLLAFRYTSNQKEIRKEKDKIKAHLMEMRRLDYCTAHCGNSPSTIPNIGIARK